jgi:hypothetical protein
MIAKPKDGTSRVTTAIKSKINLNRVAKFPE